MIRYVPAIYCVLAFAVSLQAQSQNSPTAHQHVQVAVTKVDGAAHPELIPDSTAYRLYLLTVSELPNACQEDRNRQNAHLGPLHLSEQDHLAFIIAVDEFKSQYLTLINRYNQSAEAALAQGTQPDLETFLQQRDDVVQSTRNTLKRVLTTEAMARFDARVQVQKQQMTLHVSKEAQ